MRRQEPIKASPEQQLHILSRNILPILAAIAKGFEYDPGQSDLDDEQPICVRMTLGEYRRAVGLVTEVVKMMSSVGQQERVE